MLFFATDRNNWDTIHHVGIYLGNGKMIHTPQSGDVCPDRARLVGGVFSPPPGWLARRRRANPKTIPSFPASDGTPSRGTQTEPPVRNRRRAVCPRPNRR
ncbi:NlpC/P60 family protein [Fodinicola feengrottensis]|uniref:NlpC/P60 family protein n=1 Tax=Fodinicola feengrottensis TaxID=435914 RepID=UPI0036F4068C